MTPFVYNSFLQRSPDEAVLSIITDLLCAAFPAIFLRGLQVKLRTKIALFTLMGLGVMYVPCPSLLKDSV